MEVFDAEMASLPVSAEEAFKYITDPETTKKPSKIIFYADNSTEIRKIFRGAQGKAQSHLRGFRRIISKLLNDSEDTQVTISWCPGH